MTLSRMLPIGLFAADRKRHNGRLRHNGRPRDNGHRASRPLALVTGASSGIGAELARGLIRRGYRLIMVALEPEPMDHLVREMDAADHAVTVTADFTDHAVITRIIPPLLARHGTPEVLINCAGRGIYRRFVDHSVHDHRRLMQINHFAPLQMIELVLPGMLERGSGIVINISSMSSRCGAWGHSAYSASKAALCALTHSLAAEFADTDIHFCCVYPGIVATRYFQYPDTQDLWELVRSHAIPATPVADRILALLDKPRLELYIPRSYRLLEWMKAIAPRLTHALVTRQSRPRNHGLRVASASRSRSFATESTFSSSVVQ